MKIAVAGLGSVGLSSAVLPGVGHGVIGLDLDASRVAKVNGQQSSIEEPELSRWLAEETLDFSATIDADPVLDGADCVVIATLTKCNLVTQRFDISSIESVIASAVCAAL